MKLFFRIIIIAAALYTIIVLAVTFGQRMLMYMPPSGDKVEAVVADINASHALIQPTQLHNIITGSNNALNFIYTPPADETAPVFVVMLGNGHSNHTRQFYTETFGKKGFGVLIIGYPGYGDNQGAPTELSLYDAARRQMRWLQYEQKIAPSRTIIFGQSIGSGIATEMATEFGFAALILESPFTSASDVATARFPIFPVRRLIWDAYDNIDKIKQITQPTMIYQGTSDIVIPATMGPALMAASPAPIKKSYWVKGAGHNNLADFTVDGVPMLDAVAAFAIEQSGAAR